jgi:predicted ATPase
MLRSLKIEGFKAYGDAVIALRPFTVLIGPNGAGKTTLMEAIDILNWLVTGTIAELMERKGWEYGDLPHLRAPTKAFSITATLWLRGRIVVWKLGLGARRRPGISHEKVTVFPEGADGTGDDGDVVMERTGRRMTRKSEKDSKSESLEQTLTSSWLSAVSDDDKKRFPWLVAVASWARAIRGYFFLDPLKLRAPSRIQQGDGIGVNGESLASFLFQLRRRDRAAFMRVQKRVQKHYPRLVELTPKAGKYGWTNLEVTERWNGETAQFNARQVSSGLLRLVTVAAMHELPERPSVLLLDEIENGVHPHLLGGFVKMLQELVAEGETQVILATHSPLTVNFCDPGDVILVTRGKHGHPTCVPLDRTKGFERLARHFGPGELWYNVGEDALTR